MQYMIHACPQRMWYVEEFLLPSLLAQGIAREEITVWNDTDGKGNLLAFMESMRVCGHLRNDAVWHLQDDVLVSELFAERTQAISSGVACGFGCSNWDLEIAMTGRVPMQFAWYSFQCIRIPNVIAAELADWFFGDAVYRERWKDRVADKKHDDWFFRKFLEERHKGETVTNVRPCLVEHVDWLIGGTVINRDRRLQQNRAAYWTEPELIERLAKALEERAAARAVPTEKTTGDS